MYASENANAVAVPISLVTVDPASGDSAILVPPDALRPEVPAGTGTEVASFALDETGTSDFERNPSALRAGDSVQTFIGVAEPSACPDPFGPADADSD